MLTKGLEKDDRDRLGLSGGLIPSIISAIETPGLVIFAH